jgi:Pyruvate/2-oxoacid:ferredoxin oxidoreductase delta subunit
LICSHLWHAGLAWPRADVVAWNWSAVTNYAHRLEVDVYRPLHVNNFTYEINYVGRRLVAGRLQSQCNYCLVNHAFRGKTATTAQFWFPYCKTCNGVRNVCSSEQSEEFFSKQLVLQPWLCGTLHSVGGCSWLHFCPQITALQLQMKLSEAETIEFLNALPFCAKYDLHFIKRIFYENFFHPNIIYPLICIIVRKMYKAESLSWKESCILAILNMYVNDCRVSLV